MKTLSYKSAKQLKDAGFPQGGKGKYHMDGIIAAGDAETIEELLARALAGHSALVYVPTLPELIRACGDDFGSLRLSQLKYTEDRWIAKNAGSADPLESIVADGQTPEEAVKNLWLALEGDRQREAREELKERLRRHRDDCGYFGSCRA